MICICYIKKQTCGETFDIFECELQEASAAGCSQISKFDSFNFWDKFQKTKALKFIH